MKTLPTLLDEENAVTVSKASTADVLNAVLKLQLQIATANATTASELKHIGENLDRLTEDFKKMRDEFSTIRASDQTNRQRIAELERDNADQETRLRALEKLVWKAAGGMATAAFGLNLVWSLVVEPLISR